MGVDAPISSSNSEDQLKRSPILFGRRVKQVSRRGEIPQGVFVASAFFWVPGKTTCFESERNNHGNFEYSQTNS